MCLVVDYSEKSVKSDYFGVIMYNWWRKVRKSGYSLYKMLILLKVHTNNLNIRDFRFKTYSGAFLQAEYTENSGYSMVFFRKIRKITISHTKLISSIKFVGRKLRKIGFFAKTSNVFMSFALKLVAQVTIAEHTENSHNSHLYTIQHKSVRNSHLLSQRFGISSSATTIVIPTSVNCSQAKISKEQLTPHTSIVKEDYGKCYKHAPFFFKCTIVSTGVTNAQITKTTKTYGHCKLQYKQI